MNQSYSLFTLIFKGVHEPFGFDSLLLLTFLRSSRMFCICSLLSLIFLRCSRTLQVSGLFTVITYYFFKVFTNASHLIHCYTPSSMKIGELSHRIFSFIKEKFSSIAALRFKILTKIKGKKHGSKFGFHTGWSISPIFFKVFTNLTVSYWMEYSKK